MRPRSPRIRFPRPFIHLTGCRIAKEHAELKRAAEASAAERPTKRRRLPKSVQGVHAYDMSLVTPENVSTRGKWRVTPTGRLIRPMRMRPSHPLPAPLDAKKPGKEKPKAAKGKKRVRDPPYRAKRRTIDPTRWGSQHLKGIFLENAAAIARPALVPSTSEPDGQEESGNESETGEDDDGTDEESEEEEDIPNISPPPVTLTAEPLPRLVAPPTSAKPSVPASVDDLDAEKKQSLGLLQSLFGGKEEWGGAESVGSDVEEDDLPPAIQPISAREDQGVEDAGTAMDIDGPVPNAPPEDRAPTAVGNVQKTRLKDLFAPREEEGVCIVGRAPDLFN